MNEIGLGHLPNTKTLLKSYENQESLKNRI